MPPSITDDIEETQRQAREQEMADIGGRIEQELTDEQAEIYRRGREAAEAEVSTLPAKYQGKTPAEVYSLMQKELEYKLKQKEGAEPTEDDPEGPPGEEEAESPAPEESEATTVLRAASEEFYTAEGKLKPETVQKLEALPSDQLIKAWQALQAEAPPPQAPLSDAEAQEIVQGVGGQEAYDQALRCAAENLSDDDKASYDTVIQSGNKAATRFAVEALTTRYKAAVGFDGDPVSGGRVKTSKVKPYRSEAELRRDLSNPRYQEDPAFRIDVEDRLAASGELL